MMLGRLSRHEEQDRADFKRVRKDIGRIFERIEQTATTQREVLDGNAREAREAAERLATDLARTTTELATKLAETNAKRDEQIASLKRIVWTSVGGFGVVLFILKEIVIPIFIKGAGAG